MEKPTNQMMSVSYLLLSSKTEEVTYLWQHTVYGSIWKTNLEYNTWMTKNILLIAADCGGHIR